MSEECRKHRVEAPIVAPSACASCELEKVRGDRYGFAVENERLRAELTTLKAGQGEAVAWRDHSVNYAKGEKCPATIETLQAAWDRDQELMLDQKTEISRLKETINQLRQRRNVPPASANAVSVPRKLLERAMWPKNGSELIKANRELRALLARQGEKS